MCDINFKLTLFTPDSDKEQQFCEVKATNVFSKNGLQISAPKMMQLRNWLTTLPFMMQEGLWEDMKTHGGHAALQDVQRRQHDAGGGGAADVREGQPAADLPQPAGVF